MCLASAYRLRLLLPHARRLSVLTTTLRSPMPVGSFHDAFALRFYSHETWLHPPYLWTNVRTNRHCISTEIARMQLAQVTNKTEIVSAIRRLIYPKILRFLRQLCRSAKIFDARPRLASGTECSAVVLGVKVRQETASVSLCPTHAPSF